MSARLRPAVPRAWRRVRRLAWCGLLPALLAAPLPREAAAQPGSANVKAALVFNFARFTEWPALRLPARDTPLSLCVWADDVRLSDAMKVLGGRLIDERSVRVADVDRVELLARCHVLFIADTAPRAAVPAWLRKAEAMDVLTVGDADAFAASGGMIGLVSDGSRLRFEINERAIKRSGLKLGAQLYQLGRMINEDPLR